MLRLSGEPFQFRYVSFQKGMHKTPAFLALSRWGQVPVLLDGDHPFFQSAAIVEYLAETLGRYAGADPATRQAMREWLYWNADVLFPPIFGCYGVRLGEQKLLPINVDPAIAAYHRQRAGYALTIFDAQLADKSYLCGKDLTIADIVCAADLAFAELCEFDLGPFPIVSGWLERIKAHPRFLSPFDLLKMEDAEIT